MEVQLLCALQPRYANDVLTICPKTSEYVIGGIEIYPQVIFADAGPWHLRFEPAVTTHLRQPMLSLPNSLTVVTA